MSTSRVENVDLLRTVMEHVTRHPDQLDMDVWGVRYACGTEMCIAGWAAVFAEAEQNWQTLGSENVPVLSAVKIDERWRGPEEAAEVLLGLTREDADRLFFADDLDDVWEIVEEITDGLLTRAEVEATVRTVVSA
jgi:hypothetical protein